MRSEPKNPLTALCLRILVAGYLVYLGWQIHPEKGNILLLAAAILFMAAGASFAVWAVLQFRKSRGAEEGKEEKP